MSIYAKLSAAKAEFPAITKDKTARVQTKGGGSYTYSYADLGSVVEAVDPKLAAAGLVTVQVPVVIENRLFLQTTIAETEGDGLLAGLLPLPSDVDSQALGSAITYARRYALVTMLGLVTEDDDDGAAHTHGERPSGAGTYEVKASVTPAPAPAPVAQVPTPEGWLSDDDCVQAHNELFDRIQKLPADELGKCKKYRQEHGWPLPVAKFDVLKAQVADVEARAVASVAEAFPGAAQQS